MNILFIEISIPPTRGGVERASWVLSRYFNENGHDSYFAFFLQDYEEVDKQHKIRIGKNGVIGNCVEQLYQFVKSNDIKIIINQQCRGKNIAAFLQKIRREEICKVIYCHHLSPNYSEYQPLKEKLKLNNIFRQLFWKCDNLTYQEKRQYELCDRFVLLSETFKYDFIKRIHTNDPSKLRWISDPLSFPFQSAKENMQKQRQVIIISRLYERQKNITSALRIWKEIELRGYDDWQLILGGYGPDEKKILNYANKLGIKRMSFIGKVEDPINLYKESAIFMMTSNYEGFGMTLTEALQFGCVPIAFDNYTALHEILEDGYNGFIIPSEDEQKYADILGELMKDNNMLQKLSLNAYESSKKFSINVIGHKWIELIDELKV